MKKVLLIAAIAVSALKVSAQTEKGKIAVGGTIDYTTSKSDADDAKSDESFTILPVASYFVENNISIGTGIGYTYSKDASGPKTGAFVVSPFGRYYKSLGEQFKFFGELAVPLAFGTVKNSAGDKTSTYNAVGVSLSPGFVFFPTKKFGLELGFNGINYMSTTVKDANDDKVKGLGSKTFNIGADFFSPQIGVQFYF